MNHVLHLIYNRLENGFFNLAICSNNGTVFAFFMDMSSYFRECDIKLLTQITKEAIKSPL